MGYLEEHGIEAVCFDIDGTLYPPGKTNRVLVKDSLLHLPFALKYMRARKLLRVEDGYENLPETTRDAFLERTYRIMYPKGNKSFFWFAEKLDKVFVQQWRKDFKDLVSFPDVKEVLLELKKVVKIGIMSDFPIGVKLEAMGIQEVPDVVFSTEEVGHLKPARTCFLALASKVGVSPEHILYVGDSESKDVLGAKKAGMHAMLITSDRKKMACSKADLVVSSYREIEKILL